MPKQGASDPRTGPSKVIRYNHRLCGPPKRYSICRPNWMAGCVDLDPAIMDRSSASVAHRALPFWSNRDPAMSAADRCQLNGHYLIGSPCLVPYGDLKPLVWQARRETGGPAVGGLVRVIWFVDKLRLLVSPEGCAWLMLRRGPIDSGVRLFPGFATSLKISH